MLREEMEAFIRKSVELFEFLAHNNRHTSFPNLFITLRIYITISVTLASGKRSFSMLKPIKTYLRSSIQQGRLNILAILSIIESKISRGLNMDKILKDCWCWITKNKFLLAKAIFVSQATIAWNEPLGADLSVSFGIVVIVQHCNTRSHAL